MKYRGTQMFEDIKNSSDWQSVDKVSKGWSSDSKYFIKTKEGKMLLLRISDMEQYETKKKEYEIVEKYSKLGFLMSQPIDFGICNNGKNVYMLLTWIEGKDLEEVLSDLTEEQQYQLGRQAGKILKKIHSIDVDINDIPKDTKKSKKLQQLSRYEESHVPCPLAIRAGPWYNTGIKQDRRRWPWERKFGCWRWTWTGRCSTGPSRSPPGPRRRWSGPGSRGF